MFGRQGRGTELASRRAKDTLGVMLLVMPLALARDPSCRIADRPFEVAFEGGRGRQTRLREQPQQQRQQQGEDKRTRQPVARLS